MTLAVGAVHQDRRSARTARTTSLTGDRHHRRHAAATSSMPASVGPLAGRRRPPWVDRPDTPPGVAGRPCSAGGTGKCLPAPDDERACGRAGFPASAERPPAEETGGRDDRAHPLRAPPQGARGPVLGRRGRRGRADDQRHHPSDDERLRHAGTGVQGRQPDRPPVRQRRRPDPLRAGDHRAGRAADHRPGRGRRHRTGVRRAGQGDPGRADRGLRDHAQPGVPHPRRPVHVRAGLHRAGQRLRRHRPGPGDRPDRWRRPCRRAGTSGSPARSCW